MALRRREDIEARAGVDVKRLARRGMGSLIYTGLVVAAVVLILGLSLSARERWDVSISGGNTLSPYSEEMLEQLDGDVEIYPLFTTGNAQREDYWYLLQLFRDASSHVSVEFIDPVAQPGAVKRLGLDPTEENVRLNGVTVVARGDRHLLFRGVEEEDVTNAIVEVTSTDKRVVGFIRGYGERDPSSDVGTGLSRAARALQQEYYGLADVFLSEGIPPQVNVLVAAGLTSRVTDDDLQRLEAWLEDAGRLLVLHEPGVDAGLGPVLERWGLATVPQQIFDPRENINSDPTFLKITRYSHHEIVKPFGKNFPTAFPVAGPVIHFDPGDPLVFHDDLALTSDWAIGVAQDGTRTEGPFTVAAASWVNPDVADAKQTRVVLVGDTDFASNQYLPARANSNFLLNCVGWLSRERGLISIRSQPVESQMLDVRVGDIQPILLAVFGAPVLVALTGIIVFSRRRSL